MIFLNAGTITFFSLGLLFEYLLLVRTGISQVKCSGLKGLFIRKELSKPHVCSDNLSNSEKKCYIKTPCKKKLDQQFVCASFIWHVETYAVRG